MERSVFGSFSPRRVCALRGGALLLHLLLLGLVWLWLWLWLLLGLLWLWLWLWLLLLGLLGRLPAKDQDHGLQRLGLSGWQLKALPGDGRVASARQVAPGPRRGLGGAPEGAGRRGALAGGDFGRAGGGSGGRWPQRADLHGRAGYLEGDREQRSVRGSASPRTEPCVRGAAFA